MLKRAPVSNLFQPSPVAAEAYAAPSHEAWRLVRRARWLTSPEDGRSPTLGRYALHALVAPMTQLTFLSFDLQAFLFVVFHKSRVALFGHGIFQTSVNLFLMAALREVTVIRSSFATVDAGQIFLAVLLAWYGAIAAQARLRAWFVVISVMLGAMYCASGALAAACREDAHVAPAWGVLASALLVALSHAGESDLPPRTVDPWRWTPLREHLLEPGIGVGGRILRVSHAALLTVTGTASEAWASLRLMPYNWLFAMMRLGYATSRFAEIRDWCDRAWATGNPALDFVGTGGGTFLAPPCEIRKEN